MEQYVHEITFALCQLIYFIFFKYFISSRNLLIQPLKGIEAIMLIGFYGFLIILFCLYNKWYNMRHNESVKQ